MSFSSDLRSLKKLVQPGSRWRHYKNPKKVYLVLGVGHTTENTKLVIIYRNEQSDDIWVRHHSEWFAQVGDEKRFTRILTE